MENTPTVLTNVARLSIDRQVELTADVIFSGYIRQLIIRHLDRGGQLM